MFLLSIFVRIAIRFEWNFVGVPPPFLRCLVRRLIIYSGLFWRPLWHYVLVKTAFL